MSKLKPCPFCGGTNITMQKWDITKSYFVMCHGCPARMEDLIEQKSGQSKPMNLKGAVKAWNRRNHE